MGSASDVARRIEGRMIGIELVIGAKLSETAGRLCGMLEKKGAFAWPLVPRLRTTTEISFGSILTRINDATPDIPRSGKIRMQLIPILIPYRTL